MSKAPAILINFFAIFHLSAHSADIYEFLGLDSNASKQTIKERCHELQRESHPDKGGSDTEFIKYRTACDQLLHPEKATHVPPFTPPPPPPPPADTQEEKTNNSSWRDRQKAWEEFQEETRRQQERFKQENFHFNETPPPQDNSRFDWDSRTFNQGTGSSNDGFHQYEEPRDLNIGTVYVIPRIIQAPIYSLPLAESLTSNLQHADEYGCWTFAFEPFGKIPSGKTPWGFKETEGGLLIAMRYGQQYWFFDTTISINGNHSTLETPEKTYACPSHRVVFDGLDSLGIFYDAPRIYAELKALLGVTSPRCKSEDQLLDVPTVSAGLQASINSIVHEAVESKCVLVGQFRWLYFFKNSPKIELSYQLGPSHLKKAWQTLSITPGSFIDLLLGFDERLGCDYQHHIEAGYNPTFHIGGPMYPDRIADEHYILTIANGQHDVDLTRHSLYGIYTYECTMGNVLTAWSLGASINIQKMAHIDASPATIWASCAINF